MQWLLVKIKQMQCLPEVLQQARCQSHPATADWRCRLRFDVYCQPYPPSIRIKGGQIRVRPRKDVNFPYRSEDFQLNTEHPKPSAIMQLHHRPVAHTVQLVAHGVDISVTSGTAPKPKRFEAFPPCPRARAADAEAELQPQ